MIKILGLDLGSKRIGVAISDGLGITAQSMLAIEEKTADQVFEKLKVLVTENGVEKIVVGLPLNMDGTSGPQARKAESFAKDIENKFNLPVALWDERLTTAEIERVMIKADVSRGKRKKRADKLAAQVMLQSYLDAQKVK